MRLGVLIFTIAASLMGLLLAGCQLVTVSSGLDGTVADITPADAGKQCPPGFVLVDNQFCDPASSVETDASNPDGDGGNGPGSPGEDRPAPDAGPSVPDAAPPPRPDGACPGVPEICDGQDDDCDGVVDNGFDLKSDLNNCGQCGKKCAEARNAVPRCIAGICTWRCADGFSDADGNLANGCEGKGGCVPSGKEACNGRDDDCDGQADNFVEACNSLCGAGERTCVNGVWSVCTAKTINCRPGDRRSCSGSCGDEGFQECTSKCEWSPCIIKGGASAGQCKPGEKRKCDGACGGGEQTCQSNCIWSPCSDPGSPQCQAGQSESRTCGSCGAQRRTCSSNCAWSDWGVCAAGECTPGEKRACDSTCGGAGTQECGAGCTWGLCRPNVPGTCTPGENQEEPCGKCGKRSRVCTASCQWSAWTTCVNEGECVPSATEACQTVCGAGLRTCSNQCNWGSCQGPAAGECKPNEVQTEACGNCGVRSRTCGASCEWGGWTACRNEGVCAPGAEEPCQSSCGSGKRTCSATCTWSNCDGPTSGVCQPPNQKVTKCGTKCGQNIQVCMANCQWGPESGCINEGECSAGATDTRPCGLCGVERRTCSSSTCTWGSWGNCESQGVCQQGASRTGPCGKCGTSQQTCGQTCQWEAAGACTGEKSCTPGTTRQQPCGDKCGYQISTCQADCEWGPWGVCQGEGVCPVGQTREVGCGTQCRKLTQTCDATCNWVSGACGGGGVCEPGLFNPVQQSCSTTSGCPGLRYQSCDPNCQYAYTECQPDGSGTPDMAVTSITLNDGPGPWRANATINYQFNLTNLGCAPVTFNTELFMTTDPNGMVREFSVGIHNGTYLLPGQSLLMNGAFIIPQAAANRRIRDWKVTAFADFPSPGVVNELTENNNHASTSIMLTW
ncbi:MAG: hypothetical protein GMKNLPBB_02772 [Myxococcota bacterium]|nr:hypothetical protein [Myxococcota bacterium]